MKLEFKDKLFNEFYKNNRSPFVEKLILWSVVFNPECDEKTFKKILKETINENDKEAFTQNYLGSRTTKYTLKKVTNSNLKKLLKSCYELDGTLLSDIVAEYMETHKVL